MDATKFFRKQILLEVRIELTLRPFEPSMELIYSLSRLLQPFFIHSFLGLRCLLE